MQLGKSAQLILKVLYIPSWNLNNSFKNAVVYTVAFYIYLRGI